MSRHARYFTNIASEYQSHPTIMGVCFNEDFVQRVFRMVFMPIFIDISAA